MLKQIKYSLKSKSSIFLPSLIITTLLNIVFTALSYANVYGIGGKITGVTLCSLALAWMIIISIISDAEMIKNLFSSPGGYHNYLAPVEPWKILLSRIAAISISDVLALAIGITGVTFQSISLMNFNRITRDTPIGMVLLLVLVFFLYYILVIATAFFAAAVSKSIFYRFKARGFFGVVTFFATMYILSLLDFALLPFAFVNSFGTFFMVNIELSFNLGMVIFILINLIKIAIVAFTTSYLMERKINI